MMVRDLEYCVFYDNVLLKYSLRKKFLYASQKYNSTLEMECQ